MYRQAIRRLIDEVAETEEFFRAGIVAIDITEANPFTGDRTGHGDEIIGTKRNTDEYAYQWATVQSGDDFMAGRAQRLDEPAADEPGRSNNEDTHSRMYGPLRQGCSVGLLC